MGTRRLSLLHLSECCQRALARGRGITSVAGLAAEGVSRRGVEYLIDENILERVGAGHFIAAGRTDDFARAARLGARLTATSLFAALGGWRPMHDHALHVSGYAPPSRWRPVPSSVQVHRSQIRGVLLAEPMESAIAHTVASFGRDDCVAIFESLIRVGAVAKVDVVSALHRAGRRVDCEIANLLDPSSESGAETLFRLYLRGKRIRFRTQVAIGPYRVDFLVGRRLIVEVVGAAFHGDRQAFEYDGTREAHLHCLGYAVLRVTALQVYERMDEVDAVVTSMVRRGQHRYGPRLGG